MRALDYELEDTRLNRRAKQSFERIAEYPHSEFPEIFDSAELEGFYRFLHNPRVTFASLVESGVQKTEEQLVDFVGEVLLLHDTTEVHPIKANSIDGIDLEQKFWAHLSLVVGSERRVFGMGALSCWSRDKGYRSDRSESKGSEFDRWLDHIERLHKRWPDVDFINVMDREADACEIWSKLMERNERFVIRICHNRHAKNEKGQNSWLYTEIAKASVAFKKSFPVAARSEKGLAPRSKKRHPPREERIAQVQVFAKTICVHKSSLRSNHPIKETIEINVVRVLETCQAKDRIEWILITSEPIKTKSEVGRVVEFYRQRWLVEEFFKGLKTGCRLEQRHFQDLSAWYRLIAFLAPIAVTILNLRWQANRKMGGDINALTPIQIKILSMEGKKHSRKLRSSKDYYEELAKLGGHIKSNGPPGWLILLRGMMKLISIEYGWKLAMKDVISP